MRELIAEAPKGVDIVILFHKPFLKPVSYAFLKESLQDLVKRLNQAKI
jgi:RNase P protein component